MVESAPAPTLTAGRNVVTELVGTVLVMLAGPGVIVLTGGEVGVLGAAIAMGAATALAIGVIGALANPAFSLALMLVREISPREAAADWLGQLLGGVVGAAMIWGIDDRTRRAIGTNGWDRDGYAELGSVISAELVFTLLIVVVLLSALSRGLSPGAVAGATGVATMLTQLVLIGLDGGGANPARSIGSAPFGDADPSPLGQVWVFVVVPLVAAVAAVFVWLVIDDAEIDDTLFDETVLDDLHDAITDPQS